VRPADPLGDHRGRHRRRLLQQLTNPWLHRIHHRPPHRPRIRRRAIAGQRPPDSVPRDPQPPRDRLDRHPLRPVQPSDLSPVLHCHHPSQGHAGGSFSAADRGSVFTRRRHGGPTGSSTQTARRMSPDPCPPARSEAPCRGSSDGVTPAAQRVMSRRPLVGCSAVRRLDHGWRTRCGGPAARA
jgi:hypothetical protein